MPAAPDVVYRQRGVVRLSAGVALSPTKANKGRGSEAALGFQIALAGGSRIGSLFGAIAGYLGGDPRSSGVLRLFVRPAAGVSGSECKFHFSLT